MWYGTRLIFKYMQERWHNHNYTKYTTSIKKEKEKCNQNWIMVIEIHIIEI